MVFWGAPDLAPPPRMAVRVAWCPPVRVADAGAESSLRCGRAEPPFAVLGPECTFFLWVWPPALRSERPNFVLRALNLTALGLVRILRGLPHLPGWRNW